MDRLTDLRPLVTIFGFYAKNDAEQRGRELQGPSVDRFADPKLSVIIFGFYAKNAAQRWGRELRGPSVSRAVASLFRSDIDLKNFHARYRAHGNLI